MTRSSKSRLPSLEPNHQSTKKRQPLHFLISISLLFSYSKSAIRITRYLIPSYIEVNVLNLFRNSSKVTLWGFVPCLNWIDLWQVDFGLRVVSYCIGQRTQISCIHSMTDFPRTKSRSAVSKHSSTSTLVKRRREGNQWQVIQSQPKLRNSF